jgi:hypothetical protein
MFSTKALKPYSGCEWRHNPADAALQRSTGTTSGAGEMDGLRPPEMSIEDCRYSVGTGNWEFFERSGITLDDIYESAADWALALKAVKNPWLCWNVDDNWCLVQQRLVNAVGWTPVVGFDPRVHAAPLEPGSILIDFNKKLQLPTMWMHFVLEFIHLFCDRLAFWHTDCLLGQEKMQTLADLFAWLPDGWTAAVQPNESLRARLSRHQRRYWEVVGCTTRDASQNSFDNGCGWWMSFANHPSNSETERSKRSKYYWDHGVGVRFWHKHCGGQVHLIPESYIVEGHFTGTGRKDYRRALPNNFRRDLSRELSSNYDLVDCCRKLGIEGLMKQSET